MTHTLFVESNTTGSGAIAVRMLLERGDSVTFVTRDRARYPFLGDAILGRAEARPTSIREACRPGFSPARERVRIVDAETNDLRELTACAERLSAERRIDAVVTFSTFYVATVAALGARLGLPFLSERAAATCHDKIAARRALQAAGLANPEFWSIATEDDAARVAGEVAYPCIMKPPADSGSSGVLQIEDEQQFVEHYRRLAAATTNDRGQAGSSSVLVEELLAGPEVSVETMTLGRTLAPGATQVIGITRKYLSPPPYFVELGHDFPAPLPDAERAAIERCVLDGLDAVGFDFGPAHTEVRLTARGPVIVEINPRLAGGMIPELVRLATGIDLIDAYLRLLAGHSPSLTPTTTSSASIRFLVAPHPGTLATLPAIDDLRQSPGVDRIELTVSAGKVIQRPRSAYDRLGSVICSGDDAPERATAVAATLAARLQSAIQ